MKCKEEVWHSIGMGTLSRCSRDAVIDGYCKQHSPAAKAKRAEASRDRVALEAERRRAPARELRELRAECERLRTERDRAICLVRKYAWESGEGFRFLETVAYVDSVESTPEWTVASVEDGGGGK